MRQPCGKSGITFFGLDGTAQKVISRFPSDGCKIELSPGTRTRCRLMSTKKASHKEDLNTVKRLICLKQLFLAIFSLDKILQN